MNIRIAIAAVALVVAVVGLRYYMSRGESEGTGKPLAQVTVPPLSGEAKEGEALFNANCAKCHGENAAGNEGAGPPLVHVIYQPGHHSDAAFYLAARNGAIAHHWSFGNMPPAEGVTDDDVTKILAYVRTLQRANGIN
ncbi:MAG: cytochrome c [Notoacmeibacter sp.]|nr:cytochrome c [Notoacmeibacter sp.]